MRATPPAARMSAGTRSSAITATAPASSAIRACSAVVTSMMTPPLSISASPRLTRNVALSGIGLEYRGGDAARVMKQVPRVLRRGQRGAGSATPPSRAGRGRSTQCPRAHTPDCPTARPMRAMSRPRRRDALKEPPRDAAGHESRPKARSGGSPRPLRRARRSPTGPRAAPDARRDRPAGRDTAPPVARPRSPSRDLRHRHRRSGNLHPRRARSRRPTE